MTQHYLGLSTMKSFFILTSFSNQPGREAYVLVLSADDLTVATELKDHKQPNLQMMLRGIVNLMGAHNVMDCCENGIRSI